jgi:hypothetical protein
MMKERRIRLEAYEGCIGETAHKVLVRRTEECGALRRTRYRGRVILK